MACAHDDGVSLDVFVDWLDQAGHRIQRMTSYSEWFERFATALRALPEKQRQQSLLPLLSAFREPAASDPVVPAERFRATVQDAGVAGTRTSRTSPKS